MLKSPFALLFALALTALDCGDTRSSAAVRPAEATAALPAPPVAPPAPAPSAAPAPPAAQQETLRPQFVVSKPTGWVTKDPLIDTTMLLTKDRDDAVIIMNNPVASKGSALQECRALKRYFAVDRRSHFSRIRVAKDGSCSFKDWGMTSIGMRYGTITVRHYGKGGRISVSYLGYWPTRSKQSSEADYKDFVRSVTLVHE